MAALRGFVTFLSLVLLQAQLHVQAVKLWRTCSSAMGRSGYMSQLCDLNWQTYPCCVWRRITASTEGASAHMQTNRHTFGSGNSLRPLSSNYDFMGNKIELNLVVAVCTWDWSLKLNTPFFGLCW